MSEAKEMQPFLHGKYEQNGFIAYESQSGSWKLMTKTSINTRYNNAFEN